MYRLAGPNANVGLVLHEAVHHLRLGRLNTRVKALILKLSSRRSQALGLLTHQWTEALRPSLESDLPVLPDLWRGGCSGNNTSQHEFRVPRLEGLCRTG